jgi:hypothetical protein
VYRNIRYGIKPRGFPVLAEALFFVLLRILVFGLRMCELKTSRIRVRASGRAVKMEGREEGVTAEMVTARAQNSPVLYSLQGLR